MPASLGVHGPGEMISCAGLQREDFVDRDLVVAIDANLERRIDLAQPLHEVVGERIVVVDELDHGAIEAEQGSGRRFAAISGSSVVRPHADAIAASAGTLSP